MTKAAVKTRAKVANKKPATKKPRATKNPLKLGNCSKCKGVDVPFYTDKTGKKTNCVDCRIKYNQKYHSDNRDSQLARSKAYYADNIDRYKARALLPMDTPCPYHPTCTWWNTFGNNCGYCDAVIGLVCHSAHADADRGLESTMTREFVDQHIGTDCAACGYGPLLPQQEANHPRQLSMDRIDNSKPHDCDPAQTQAICNQCNAGKWIHSMEQFFVFLNGIVAAVPDVVSADAIAFIEDDGLWKEKLRRKDRCRSVSRQNKPLAPEVMVEFTLCYDDVVKQLREQNYCCSLCHLALQVNDCSFDQTVANNGYVAGKFTFMHQGCNMLKGEWPIEVAIETAHRAVAFRKSKTE